MLALLQLRIALTVTWKFMVVAVKWTWLLTLWTVKAVAALFPNSKKGGSK